MFTPVFPWEIQKYTPLKIDQCHQSSSEISESEVKTGYKEEQLFLDRGTRNKDEFFGGEKRGKLNLKFPSPNLSLQIVSITNWSASVNYIFIIPLKHGMTFSLSFIYLPCFSLHLPTAST